MTTQNPPYTHAGMEGDLGYAYVFAAQEILKQVRDRLNVLALGFIGLRGDLAGSGSDTIRVAEMDGPGFGSPMVAIATENGGITASPITTAYASVTVGLYGVAHEETYFGQALSREPGVSLDVIKGQVPDSFLRMLRILICDVGAAFSTDVGSKSVAQSIDDLIDLRTAYAERLGRRPGTPFGLVRPQQITQLLASARNDPAFQNSVAEFSAVQKLQDADVYRNLLGMGFDFAVTDDVESSGGGYDGFVSDSGGIGWARASTTPIRPANPQGAMYLPEIGTLIEEIPSTGTNGVRRFEARAIVGAAAGSSSVYTHRGF